MYNRGSCAKDKVIQIPQLYIYSLSLSLSLSLRAVI